MEPGERGDCDLGVPYEMAAATAGEERPADGKIDMDEAHKAQEVAREQHAYANPDDKPMEMSMDHHPRKE